MILVHEPGYGFMEGYILGRQVKIILIVRVKIFQLLLEDGNLDTGLKAFASEKAAVGGGRYRFGKAVFQLQGDK